MDIYGIHAADLQSLESEQGDKCETVTWNGQKLKCLSGADTMAAILAFGGFEDSTDKVVVVMVAEFADNKRPVRGQTMIYDSTGVVYRIGNIVTAAGERQIHYGLISPTKGASGR